MKNVPPALRAPADSPVHALPTRHPMRILLMKYKLHSHAVALSHAARWPWTPLEEWGRAFNRSPMQLLKDCGCTRAEARAIMGNEVLPTIAVAKRIEFLSHGELPLDCWLTTPLGALDMLRLEKGSTLEEETRNKAARAEERRRAEAAGGDSEPTGGAP